MKVICIPEPGRAILSDGKAPETCGPSELIIRTLCSGLSNGTERNILMGGNYGGGYPRFPGYQIVGRVETIGERVRSFRLNDLVYCANVGPSFGHKEYIVAHEDSLLIRLEPDDDLTAMSLVAVASVAYRNTLRLRIQKNERVLVFGGGIIGQVSAQVARNCGAEVTLVAGARDKIQAARDCGIGVINRREPDYIEQLNFAKPWNACLETTGADVLDLIIGRGWEGGLLGYEGRIALVSGRHTVSYDSNAAQSKALMLLQSAHFFQEHLDEVTRQVRSGAISLRPLIKDIVPIADAPRIYDCLRDTPDSLFGVVFNW